MITSRKAGAAKAAAVAKATARAKCANERTNPAVQNRSNLYYETEKRSVAAERRLEDGPVRKGPTSIIESGRRITAVGVHLFFGKKGRHRRNVPEWTPLVTKMEGGVTHLGRIAFAASLVLLAVVAEEECLTQTVFCYECDSRIQPQCADPFNYTRFSEEVITQCKGCCVKIVRMKGTRYESVWRTCTRNIQINLFMVDHVCMYESNRFGHMCFCEEDHCNAAHRQSPLLMGLAAAAAFLYVVQQRL